MQELTRFWRSLEMLIDCATVAEQWRRMTGNQYESARRFLRSSGELATFFPHPDPGICIYRVVTHGPEDHVGVCDETGERIVLNTEDLVIYELDRLALQRAIAQAFGFLPEPASNVQGRSPWRIGHFEPVAGYRFPVYLVIPHQRRSVLESVCRLIAAHGTPFVLFAPTRRSFTEECDQLLRRQPACVLPLAETTCINEDGRLVASGAGQDALEAFCRRMVPRADQRSERAFFPTPTGAAWNEVSIRFVDGHTVSASVGALRGVYNFTQMGMANRKNGSPTVQWELLRDFAAARGVLTWRSAGAERKNKKRRENLARDLQRFFRIDGDPFVRHGNGWRARIRMEPDH